MLPSSQSPIQTATQLAPSPISSEHGPRPCTHAPFLSKQPKRRPAHGNGRARAANVPHGEGDLRAQRQVAVADRQRDPFVPGVGILERLESRTEGDRERLVVRDELARHVQVREAAFVMIWQGGYGYIGRRLLDGRKKGCMQWLRSISCLPWRAADTWQR